MITSWWCHNQGSYQKQHPNTWFHTHTLECTYLCWLISTVLTEQHNHDCSLCNSRSDDDYQWHHTSGPRPLQTNRSHHSIPLLYKEGINPTTNDVTLFLLPINSIFHIELWELSMWNMTLYMYIYDVIYSRHCGELPHILGLYWVHTLAKYRCTQYHDLYLNLIWVQNNGLKIWIFLSRSLLTPRPAPTKTWLQWLGWSWRTMLAWRPVRQKPWKQWGTSASTRLWATWTRPLEPSNWLKGTCV